MQECKKIRKAVCRVWLLKIDNSIWLIDFTLSGNFEICWSGSIPSFLNSWNGIEQSNHTTPRHRHAQKLRWIVNRNPISIYICIIHQYADHSKTYNLWRCHNIVEWNAIYSSIWSSLNLYFPIPLWVRFCLIWYNRNIQISFLNKSIGIFKKINKIFTHTLR